MDRAATSRWSAASAWDGLARPGRFGAQGERAGVHIGALPDTTILAIIAEVGGEDEVSARIRARFGIDVPPPGKAHFGSGIDVVWVGPRQWLLVARSIEPLPNMRAELAADGSLVDQSDARALLRIGGPRCRDMLAKGFAIDLHPTAFSTGSAASTSVAHISVQIWQDDDAPTYVVAVPRSFGASFWSWMTAAAAEYGYRVKADSLSALREKVPPEG